MIYLLDGGAIVMRPSLMSPKISRAASAVKISPIVISFVTPIVEPSLNFIVPFSVNPNSDILVEVVASFTVALPSLSEVVFSNTV